MQRLLQGNIREGRRDGLQSAASDNKVLRLPAALPSFPRDAMARIERFGRSPTTSAPFEPEHWRLTFERRTPPFVEPLMGWTGGRDALAQVELRFPTLEDAVAYAQRQGLQYIVRHDARSRQAVERRARRRRAFSDATLRRLGYRSLQMTYGEAMAQADRNPSPPHEPGAQASPMDVARDPHLSVDDKRAILMNRAFDHYVLDQRSNDETLQEIEQALQALEGGPAFGERNQPSWKAQW